MSASNRAINLAKNFDIVRYFVLAGAGRRLLCAEQDGVYRNANVRRTIRDSLCARVIVCRFA